MERLTKKKFRPDVLLQNFNGYQGIKTIGRRRMTEQEIRFFLELLRLRISQLELLLGFTESRCPEILEIVSDRILEVVNEKRNQIVG